MTDGLSALVWGILTFSALVVIHEGGHFLAARAFGVKVHEFMVGLPGPAIRFRGPKTTYGITAVPLGGYVRIAGMEPGPEDPLLGPVLELVTRRGRANALQIADELGIDEHEADRLLLTLADWDAITQDPEDEYTFDARYDSALADDPGALLDKARSVTYRALSFPKRVVVLSAGVVLNLLTAVLVFTVVLSAWGYLQETTVVAKTTPDGGAAAAGIIAGDRILTLDGSEVGAWSELVTAIGTHQPGDRVTVVVERNGERVTLTATLGTRPGSDAPLLGVQPEFERVRPSPWGALVQSFGYIGLTFGAIAGFFNPETFATSINQSSSVIGAAYIAAEAAESSPIDYAAIVAMLSLSLGVINILPIPPLDGGKVAVEVVERLRGKPLPRNLSLGLSATGALLLFALIGYLMYADVMRFIVASG